MNKKKKILIIVSASLLLLIIAAGLIIGYILMTDRLDIEAGCYIRKTYGYVGSINYDICSINLQIFVVNDAECSFLDLDKYDAYLSGDDTAPNPLTDLNIYDTNEERHIASISFTIRFNPVSESLEDYSMLVFEDKITRDEIVFDIGLIQVENITGESGAFKCEYSPTLGWSNDLEYTFRVKASDEEPITIKNFIYNSDLQVVVSHNYPIKCEASTVISLYFDNPAGYFDIVMLRPIIVFEKKDEIERYNILSMVFTYRQSMNYEDIIDYINSTYFGEAA